MANKDQDEKDKAASDALDTKIADAVGKAIGAAMPLSMAAMGQTLGKIMNPDKPKAPVEEFSSTDRCDKCQQLRRTCKEKHVMLVVAPSNPRKFARFPGITVGAVTYISPRPGAPIYVPRDNDILRSLQVWEDEEESLKEGHSLTHNSGTLSPVSSNNKINPANPHGFRGLNPNA